MYDIGQLFKIQAVVFQTKSGGCAAFLMNNDSKTDALVVFQNATYGLPPSSISILPDCKNVAFNTAKACFLRLSTSILNLLKQRRQYVLLLEVYFCNLFFWTGNHTIQYQINSTSYQVKYSQKMETIYRGCPQFWWYLIEVGYIIGANEYHKRCIWLSVVHVPVNYELFYIASQIII